MDPTNEFGLQPSEEKLERRDEEFWTGGFTYSEADFKFPCFLEGMEEMLLLCGKSLTLLRICDPTHYLIAKQPFKQLRMKLCLNTRIIRVRSYLTPVCKSVCIVLFMLGVSELLEMLQR